MAAARGECLYYETRLLVLPIVRALVCSVPSVPCVSIHPQISHFSRPQDRKPRCALFTLSTRETCSPDLRAARLRARPFQMISLVAVAASESSDCADGVCNESFDADAFVESTCEMLASRVSIDGLIDHDTGRCGQWAAAGECDQNPDFMHERCQLSCLRRLCLASEYAMPAEYGLPPMNEEAAALALAAAIHATLGSSWLELQTAGPVRGRVANERCVAQAGASLNDEATRLLAQTWQTGIPGDNGCALTAESAAIDVRPWTDIC